MKKKRKAEPKATAILNPATVPGGLVLQRLTEDVANLQRAASGFQVAYTRLTAAIDELKLRDPYRKLEADLVSLLEAKPG